MTLVTANSPDNPWKLLPIEPPYILPEDQSLITDFNRSAREEHTIRLDIFPEPYLGTPDAPVVLLCLNPGFKERDIEQHRDAVFGRRSCENLLHAPSPYPFYLLDPGIVRTHWWDHKLGFLIKHFGQNGPSIVARSVLCVEYFPYHSKKFKHGKHLLPSQQYSFALLRRAIERQAVILIMRAKKAWCEAVPELENYRHCETASSVQNPAITPQNFPEMFEAAVEAIRSM